MVKFTVPLSDILGSAYYHYELSSSNYNPNIDSNITVTCTCKNVLGNPVSNKTLELFQNGTSVGTATTNANGIATWTINCSNWGIQHFNVENKSIDVRVTGWKTIINTSNLQLRVNGTFAEVRLHTDTTVSVTTDFKSIANWIPSDYAPKMPQYELGDYGGYMVRIDGTTIMYRSLSGSMTIKLYATFLYRY